MRSVQGNIAPARLLEEIALWKTQEQEHATVIRSVIPELEPEYGQWLSAWESVFSHTRQVAQNMQGAIEGEPALAQSPEYAAWLPQLLDESLYQSREFGRQLQLLPERSLAIRQLQDKSLALASLNRQSEFSNGVMAQLEQSGAIQWSAPRNSEDEYPEGFGGPEPADDSLNTRPNHDTPLEERPNVTWSTPLDGFGQGMDPAVGNPVPIGGHTLPPLPYAYKALEPYIDEKTMRIHHDIHHKSYVDGLNKAELKLDEARKTGDFDLVKHWERELAFNGAGHYLHTLFWDVMSPRGGGKPKGALLDEITRSFGSYDAFKKQFSEAAGKVEGGGWAILVWSPRSHRLEILTAEKHQNLSQWDVVPLLPLDVWEHAYYLKHQNDRPAYVKDWWNVVNWPYVEDRFAKARTLQWIPF
ncbi:DUF2935 domain-containing protein [Cohnella endophytica]|uniref:superoxide dismutase n=1 Tax=Cohnella endophytica TaxID=2419778 RepID=A0A494XG20_9BACL|nr:Fe-Mn family superoxide dismutase [Cohnella endophytica]RKP48792.1 DUF2935 domain-containing protein [Cohnella endophytica]